MSIEFFYKMYCAEFGPQITLKDFKRITDVDFSKGNGPINAKHFEMYSEGLGGKLKRSDYNKARRRFEKDTGPAFCGGEGSRATAMAKYTKWLRKNYPGETFSRIFSSVDLVTAWT